FVLIRQIVRNAVERLAQTVPFALEDRLGHSKLRRRLAHFDLILEALIQTPGRRHRLALIYSFVVVVALLSLVNHVHNPGSNRLDKHLRALALQKAEHIEIAIAFRRLRPEFAGYFYRRFDARAIYLDLAESFGDGFQRIRILSAIKLIQELADVLGGPSD